MPEDYICPTCEGKKHIEAHSKSETLECTYHNVLYTCPTCWGSGRVCMEKLISFAENLRVNGYSD